MLRSCAAACALVVALLVTVEPCGASVAPVGDEFQANTYTTSSQYPRRANAVARAADGSFLVVWAGTTATGSDEVVARHYGSDGTATGAEFIVNAYTTYQQSYPSVAARGGGGFVVVWQSYAQDGVNDGIFGRFVDSVGAPSGGEFAVNSYTTYGQYRPSVATAPSGGFVVAWQHYPYATYAQIAARPFDSSGTAIGADLQVRAAPGAYPYAAQAAAHDDGFAVVWSDSDFDPEFGSVGMRAYDSAGSPLTGAFRVNETTVDNQGYPAVSASDDGVFVVAWTSRAQDGDGGAIVARRFDSSGGALDAEFLVNAYTTGYQFTPAVAHDENGSFVVAWASPELDGDDYGVVARSFDAAGTSLGADILLNTYTTDAQGYGVSVAGTGSGDFVVVWNSAGQDGSSNGVFGRRVCIDRNSNGLCDATEAPGCTPFVEPDCLVAEKGKLGLAEKEVGKEAIKLKLGNVATATTQADFGDPLDGETGLGVCLFDDAGVLAASLFLDKAGQFCDDGNPCWKAKGSKGYGFKDKAGTSDGINKAQFKAGDAGKGKASVAGKNKADDGLTGVPAGLVAALAGNTMPIVQLHTTDGLCIGATLTDVGKDDGVQFKAAKK